MNGQLIKYLFICFILPNWISVSGQQCLTSGYCSNLTTNYPSCTSVNTTSTSWSAVGVTFFGGDYAYFDVVQGSTYEWSTCSTFGGTQSGDAQLTLKNTNNTNICFSDNSGLTACPYAPYLRWTATFTGQVKVLVSLYSCQNSSTALAILVWRRTNACSTIPTPSGFTSSSTSSSLTLNWNAVSGATSYSIYDCNNCEVILNTVTTNSVTFTGLQANSSYSLKVMAINGSCNSAKSTCQTVLTQGSCSAPLTQASNISFSNIQPSQMTLNWLTGNGSNRIVVCRESSSIANVPNNNSSYTANSTFGSGDVIAPNEYVVYNGNGNYCTVDGLSPTTTYYFRVFEYNCSGTTSTYNISTSSNNPKSQITPCSATIAPLYNLGIDKNGGSYSINVVAQSCSWGAAVTSGSSWISITSGSSGSTNGTCQYSVSSNGTGSSRTGKITIAGYSFNIYQSYTPVADFYANKTVINAGEQISLYDNSTNDPTSWSWTISGGDLYVSASSSDPSDQDIQFTLTNPGNYTVSLTASNNSGNSFKKIVGYISVKNVPGHYVKPTSSFAIQGSYRQKIIADPIQLGTGTYTYKHTDFNIPIIGGALTFTRYYNSINSSKNGPLGYGWSHSYNYSAQNVGDTVWDIYYPDGHSARFLPIYGGNGTSFPLYGGTYDSLVKVGSEFLLYTKEKIIYRFNIYGQLSEIKDPNGNQTYLFYSLNRLSAIQGPGGRNLSMGYDASGRINMVLTPLGRAYHYSYDVNGDLKSVIAPLGDSTKFAYLNHLMTSIINGLGNIVVENTYDGLNRIISQSDAYVKTTNITYNSPLFGDSKVVYPDGSFITVHHDSSFRETKSIDALGRVKTTTYDLNGNPDTIINEKNQLTIFQYDNLGNTSLQILPGNRSYRTKYNNFSKPTELTDPQGQATKLDYNLTTGNLLSIQLPNNSTRYFEYNSNGTLRKSTDGNGDSTHYDYNSFGDLIHVTLPTGNLFYAYDADGRPTSITDANNNVTHFGYDSNDNVVKITDALNQSQTFTYNKDNLVTSLTDKKGNKTEFSYDKKSRLVSKRNAMQGIDSFAYDVLDRMISWKNALGLLTTFSYDSNGRRTSISSPAGVIKYQYDELGHIIKQTDPNNNTTTLAYSTANFISTITDALNRTNEMIYDSIGNVKRSINYRTKSISYDYDPLSRLRHVTDVDNEITQYQYDPNGNMTLLKDGNDHTQNFTFGKLNRLKAYTDAAGNPYSMTYDPAGNLKTITKPVGSISNSYDSLNRLTKSIMSTGDTYEYSYDPNNNIKTIKNNTGTSYFYYDNLNRMTRYVDLFGKQVLYGYNAVGSITYIVYPGNDTLKYSYDNANRLISVKDWKNANPFVYTYDSAGNVKKLLYPNGTHCEYAYDAINRVISKTTYLPSNIVLYGQQYTYFNDSVRETRIGSFPTNPSVRLKYEYHDDDALLSDSVNSFKNDSNGNRILEIHGKDTSRFTYTTDQLLTSISQGGNSTTYVYDALGHRVQRINSSDQTKYVLNLNSPLSLVLQTTTNSGSLRASYIYGLGLLERIDSMGNSLFYHFDTRHNTIAITDKNDSIRATYTYSLYGVVTAKTGNIPQPFTFLGEYGVEKETDSCYYIRVRYYSALSSRFFSKDPLFGDQFDPQSLNRYIYALNSPLTLFDVSGLYCLEDSKDFFENILEVTKEIVYSDDFKTWLGKNGNIYSQEFNGNLATGGKIKYAKNLSVAIGRFNNILGVVNAYLIYEKYKNGETSKRHMQIDEISNAISMIPLFGIAWGIGWDIGNEINKLLDIDY